MLLPLARAAGCGTGAVSFTPLAKTTRSNVASFSSASMYTPRVRLASSRADARRRLHRVRRPFLSAARTSRRFWDHPFAPWSIFPTHFSTALFTTARRGRVQSRLGPSSCHVGVSHDRQSCSSESAARPFRPGFKDPFRIFVIIAWPYSVNRRLTSSYRRLAQPAHRNGVETQWGKGLGDHGDVFEWLELVCVCANVLCWFSSGSSPLPTESTSQIVPTGPRAHPSRAHTDAHALALNRITHQIKSHLSKAKIKSKTRQK